MPKETPRPETYSHTTAPTSAPSTYPAEWSCTRSVRVIP